MYKMIEHFHDRYDKRYDSVTNYNDRAKFTADPPLTGRQIRNKRRKLRRNKK